MSQLNNDGDNLHACIKQAPVITTSHHQFQLGDTFKDVNTNIGEGGMLLKNSKWTVRTYAPVRDILVTVLQVVTILTATAYIHIPPYHIHECVLGFLRAVH
jgi:hypothetical protein